MMGTSNLKKETTTLEEAGSLLMKAALDSGADAAEVCGSYSRRTKINLEKQDYQLAASDAGFLLGLRVLRGKRQGFASCNSTDARELREVALRAVEIAGFSPENPNWTIRASDHLPKEAAVTLWDDRLADLSLQTQKNWTELMLNEAGKDPRFRVNEGSVGVSAGVSLILNSLGTHKLERETVGTWGLMGLALEGSNITSFDYFGELSREAAPIAERILASTRRFRDKVLDGLDQTSAHGYKGLVFFSPRAVVDIFLSSLSYHLNGRSLVEGTGRWKLADLGRAVLNPMLNIKDMPWLNDRNGCTRFDREGTPTMNRALIERGAVSAFLFDLYCAQALGVTSTGHAIGGPSALPSVGSHTLCLQGGGESSDELHARLSDSQAEYLVVNRYSGQADPVTGDFSGVAKGGEWWSRGERLHCVKETLIAGNLFDALGSGLFGLTRETETIDSGDEAPGMVCDGISVTAQ